MVIGYTQGTFDMFHIGHLNILINAKAKCDYLIVGVNADELVYQYKNKYPVVSLENRMAIVQSIKYVDRVVRADTLDKKEMYNALHFSRLFIGSDWQGDSRWIATEEEMKKINVELFYLPHTEGISSSLLREKKDDSVEE